MPADKTATNRANAGRSTGPRSAAGKARSAQNALRHGLAVPVMADPDLSREVRDLAQRLGSHHDDGELALAIAEAQVDVGRVRMLRHALIARALKRFGALETVVEIKAGRLLGGCGCRHRDEQVRARGRPHRSGEGHDTSAPGRSIGARSGGIARFGWTAHEAGSLRTARPLAPHRCDPRL